jgi:hypothetical protein
VVIYNKNGEYRFQTVISNEANSFSRLIVKDLRFQRRKPNFRNLSQLTSSQRAWCIINYYENLTTEKVRIILHTVLHYFLSVVFTAEGAPPLNVASDSESGSSSSTSLSSYSSSSLSPTSSSSSSSSSSIISASIIASSSFSSSSSSSSSSS